VWSEPGTGSRFTVVLPQAELQRTDAMPAPPQKLATQRHRVVVVDDEPTVGRSIARMLAHHDVRIASSGKAALELIEDEPADLVLCDLMMPGMTGLDLHARLTAQGYAGGFVFVSGGAFEAETDSAVAALGVPVILKPFRAGDLRARVDELLAAASGASGAARGTSR